MARVEEASTKTYILQCVYIMAVLIFATASLTTVMHNVIARRYGPTIIPYPTYNAPLVTIFSNGLNKVQHRSFSSITSFFHALIPKTYIDSDVNEVLRVRHHLRKLSYYEGHGKGNVRITLLLVSLVGIVGVFSAITAGMMAPWLTNAGYTIIDDDEEFQYWMTANEPDEEEDDEHAQLLQRAGREAGSGSISVQRNESNEGGDNVDNFDVVVHDAAQEVEDGDEDVDGGGFRRAFGPHREARFAVVRVMDN